MTAYRVGQRVRIEVEGTVLVVDGAVQVRTDVDGESWYFKAPTEGVRVTVLSEPRPDEPQGLGAVVEAGIADWQPRRWVRTFSGYWATDLPITEVTWAELVDPVILSEGWTP